MQKFINRFAAGKLLAKHLYNYAHSPNAIVLALPRGGVPVAYEISQALAIPLDVFIVRKLGVPKHEELAMGAIATGGTIFLNQQMIDSLNLTDAAIQSIIKKEQHELKRREKAYRQDRPLLQVKNKLVILVDDGIATGATMHAALQALRQQQPKSIVIAVPVAASSTCKALEGLADQLICLYKPDKFYAVGLWYEDFTQTTDQEVITLLT